MDRTGGGQASVDVNHCMSLQIGTWDPKNLVNITEDARENRKKVSDQLANKTLIVTTVLVGTIGWLGDRNMTNLKW